MYEILRRFALITSDRALQDGRFWIWIEPGEEERLERLMRRCGHKGFTSNGEFNSLKRQVDLLLECRPDVLRRLSVAVTIN